MSKRNVLDKRGIVYTVLEVGDRWYPRTFCADTLKAIPDVNLKQDDIILCGYPRSGHHWIGEISNMLLSGATEYRLSPLESSFLELNIDPVLQKIASPRILATHLVAEHMPVQCKTKKPKTIYVMRDPKDAMLSWFYFNQGDPDGYKGNFDGWLNMLVGKFLWGTWFDHVRQFEQHLHAIDGINIHIVFYENMKEDSMEEVRKLNEFLGTNRSEEFLQAIVNKCTFDLMKTHKSKIDNVGDFKHYRKGIVGDWKTMFTEENTKLFNKVYRDRMKGSAYETRYLVDS